MSRAKGRGGRSSRERATRPPRLRCSSLSCVARSALVRRFIELRARFVRRSDPCLARARARACPIIEHLERRCVARADPVRSFCDGVVVVVLSSCRLCRHESTYCCARVCASVRACVRACVRARVCEKPERAKKSTRSERGRREGSTRRLTGIGASSSS